MITKNLKSILSLALLWAALFFTSCSDDADDDGLFEQGKMESVNFKATASIEGPAPQGLALKTVNENLEITEFLVNITEVELELDDDGRDDDDDDNDNDDDDDRDDDDSWDDTWDDDGYYGGDDELELRGPFELDLLAGEMVFASVAIPQARYEELEFEFDVNRNADSELFGKTILMRGTLNGLPFEFWHAFEEDVEIDYEDSSKDIGISSNNNEILINFNLNGIFNEGSGVDLSNAVDGNNDGIIEIHPNDADGNGSIANDIKNKIKDYIDLLDD